MPSLLLGVLDAALDVDDDLIEPPEDAEVPMMLSTNLTAYLDIFNVFLY